MISLDNLRAMPVKVYAGIGSRETPPDVLDLMRRLAGLLGSLGFTLRTGGADGADTAFEQGATGGMTEVFLPWPGFNGYQPLTMLRRPKAPEAYRIAAAAHPGWHRLGDAAKSLHARNAHQVLGADLKAPAALVLCWTRDGATEKTTSRTGGTGQAIRIAVAHGVPVYNLARPAHRATWEALLT